MHCDTLAFIEYNMPPITMQITICTRWDAAKPGPHYKPYDLTGRLCASFSVCVLSANVCTRGLTHKECVCVSERKRDVCCPLEPVSQRNQG